jgi:hypothetical protein
MKLIDYLRADGREFSKASADVESLASRAGIAASTLYMAALGHKLLGLKAARRVEDATGGLVTVADQRQDIFGVQPERGAA